MGFGIWDWQEQKNGATWDCSGSGESGFAFANPESRIPNPAPPQTKSPAEAGLLVQRGGAITRRRRR
ncbi:hypothetical protein AZ78_1155 [Lysobacter capsici AZ78]|uniref:Uncharacterized protein n=1 Tax=Lysobacter capsici AZ78 TaxID=1444315 RepID=A0A125MMJ4_9GAMM|nr:hypothetical protein AZ78_1155 [Lysobacter capsici AZ78]